MHWYKAIIIAYSLIIIVSFLNIETKLYLVAVHLWSQSVDSTIVVENPPLSNTRSADGWKVRRDETFVGGWSTIPPDATRRSIAFQHRRRTKFPNESKYYKDSVPAPKRLDSSAASSSAIRK